jgi:hypothetical protein
MRQVAAPAVVITIRRVHLAEDIILPVLPAAGMPRFLHHQIVAAIIIRQRHPVVVITGQPAALQAAITTVRKSLVSLMGVC